MISGAPYDRGFLEGLVDKLYEFRDGRVKEHLGSVSDFLEKRKLENLQELERRYAPAEKAPQKKSAAQEEYSVRKSETKQQRKLRMRVDYLEKEISRREARMAEIEKKLANPGNNDDILELTREYLEQKRDLDTFTDEWTLLMEQLEL